MFGASAVDPADLYPSLQPLRWPELGVLPALAAAIATLPAWLAPPVAVRAASSVSRDVAVAA
jgi:energy-coupling factor transport system permease protein